MKFGQVKKNKFETSGPREVTLSASSAHKVGKLIRISSKAVSSSKRSEIKNNSKFSKQNIKHRCVTFLKIKAVSDLF